MKTIVIIGGGAAGLMTAIHATTSSNRVILLEGNTYCGKKLLATGNGRCNYWNEDQCLNHYHSTTECLLAKFITKDLQQEVVSFFEQIGIVPKIKNGYYYPFSNQATSIKESLLVEAKLRGVEIQEQFLVTRIEKKGGKFRVFSSDRLYSADILVLATGSKAAPKTGSTGDGYIFAKQFGHHITPLYPSLVQLQCEGTFLKDWAGIRTEARLSLYENEQLMKIEEGELQLTDYGISGICTFNLSRFVAQGIARGKQEKIVICFLPFLAGNIAEGIEWLEERASRMPHRNLLELLEGVLTYKLIVALFKTISLDTKKKLAQCTQKEKERLSSALLAFEVTVTGTNSFDKAQVCSGGILLDEVVLDTMQSRFDPNLYLVGELLDVDGDCGGYNLGFAWMSGIVAGKSIRGRKHD